MPFLISSEISEIIDDRTRILKDLKEAKNTAAQLHQYSSQIVQDVSGVKTSEQIPARLTSEGTPPAELARALTLLQAELEKVNEAQAGIRTYEDQVQREREKRRNLIIGVGVAAITVIVVLIGVVFNQQRPIPTEQAPTVPSVSTSQRETPRAGEAARATRAHTSTKPATTAVQRKSTVTSTPKPKSEPATVTQEAASISSFPLEVTPAAVVADKKPLAIDFLIESIATREGAMRFNVTIKRHSGSDPLSWYSDENRKDEIYLTVSSQRYRLIEMGGLFTQDTTLQPGQSYAGWFTFEKPDGDSFTFHYPDVEPVEIDLEELNIAVEMSTSQKPTSTNTPSPMPTATALTLVSEAETLTVTNTPLSVSPVSKPTLNWVHIPAGDFAMGSSSKDLEETLIECNDTEGKNMGQPCQIGWFNEPQRVVFVDSFEITKYEITNSQYEACVVAGLCNKANIKVENSVPAYDEGYYSSDYPVVRVSWNDANTFCQWVNGRLPTENEWEKAARGTDVRRYPWGNSFTSSKANLGSTYPSPVGSFPEGASPYGVMDMAGNVFEWTATWGGKGYVLRGGSWNNYYFRGRVTDRGTQLGPDFANYDIGFRCARSG